MLLFCLNVPFFLQRQEFYAKSMFFLLKNVCGRSLRCVCWKLVVDIARNEWFNSGGILKFCCDFCDGIKYEGKDFVSYFFGTWLWKRLLRPSRYRIYISMLQQMVAFGLWSGLDFWKVSQLQEKTESIVTWTFPHMWWLTKFYSWKWFCDGLKLLKSIINKIDKLDKLHPVSFCISKQKYKKRKFKKMLIRSLLLWCFHVF